MKTKLILDIEKETIERAKVFSLKQGKSISGIVEDYLNSIINTEEELTVERLSGALRGRVPVSVGWKDEKISYLKKKYNL